MPHRSLTLILALLAVVLGALTAPPAAAHSPHDVTTVIAVSPDYANDGTVLAAFQFTDYKLFGRSTDGGRSWSLVSSAMTVNSIVDIEFSPRFKQDGTAFAASLGGGVWRSVDRGLTWQPIHTGLTSLAVRDMAVSPAFGVDQSLAVATQVGCFVSLDGGDSWLPANTGLTETTLTEIAFDPRGQALYVGRRVLHRSADHGATWVPLKTFVNPMSSIACDPTDSSGMTVAVSFGRFGSGVQVSSNGGLNFLPSNAGLTDLRVGAVRFTKAGGMLAVSFEGGCHLTDDVFASWSASAQGLEGLSDLSDEHYFLALPSPTFAQDGILLLASFEGFYLSFDAGQTWEQQESYSLRLNRQLAFSPDYEHDGLIFASSYGAGILVAGPPGSDAPQPAPGPGTLVESAAATPGFAPVEQLHPPTHSELPPPSGPEGLQWSARSTGLATIWGSELQFSPTFASDRTIYYAHVGLYRSTDQGHHWQQLDLPPAFQIVRAIALSSTYAEDQTLFIGGGDGQGVFRSEDAAETWTQLSGSGGLPAGPRATVIALSPEFDQDDTLFMSTTDEGLWRSTDRGDSWQLLGFDEEQVRTLALSPQFPRDHTLFIGTDSLGAFRSTDGGDSWDPVDLAIVGTDAFTVQSFGFSPGFFADGEVFALTRQGHVRFSTDHGLSWEARDTGLTKEALRVLALSPLYRQDHTLLVASHDWIWRSRDKGLSWSRLPGWVRVDDSHQSAHAFGDWTSYVVAGAIAPAPTAPGEAKHFGPGVRVTTTVGDWTELVFYGTSVAFYAELTPDSGIAEVSLDGVPVGLVNLYAPTSQPRQKVFEQDLDGAEWHRLRVTLTAGQHPASSGHALHSDGFHYTFDEPIPGEALSQGPVRLGDRLPTFAPLRASAPRHHDAHEGCPPVELIETSTDEGR